MCAGILLRLPGSHPPYPLALATLMTFSKAYTKAAVRSGRCFSSCSFHTGSNASCTNIACEQLQHHMQHFHTLLNVGQSQGGAQSGPHALSNQSSGSHGANDLTAAVSHFSEATQGLTLLHTAAWQSPCDGPGHVLC